MSEKNVYQKLMEAQTKLVAPKAQYNKFGKYNYRSCEDILTGLKKLETEIGFVVIIEDEIEVIEGCFYLKATAKFICTETKEEIKTVAFAREARDKKGMDEAQITGATSSYARKYALNALFAIDDTKDADATNTHDKEEPKKVEPVKDHVSCARGLAKLGLPLDKKAAVLDKFDKNFVVLHDLLVNAVRNNISGNDFYNQVMEAE